MERKTRARAESAAFIAVVAVALVLVNILAIRYFSRWDLTRRQLFTLSEGTRRIVSGLRDELTITVYWTPGQPPPAQEDERFVRDQLDEYRALARGRIRVRWVNTDNDARRGEADRAGCDKRALQAVNAREAQATIVEAYRCITFEYLGNREKIDFLPPGVTGLEYEVSSIIKNIMTPADRRERVIGFLGGHGELTPDQGLNYLTQLLEQQHSNYRVRTINLNGGENPVPSDIKGLVIANPTQRIEERELRQLDAYLMRGGSIAVFASGVNMSSVDPISASGTPAEHHLNDWLSHYGFNIETNVVLDERSTDVVVPMGRSAARLRLVTWPAIIAMRGRPTQDDLREQGGLDPDFPVVFRLPEIIATYPSSIRIDQGAVRRTGGTLRIFGRTSPRSVLRTSDFDLSLDDIRRDGVRIFSRSNGPHIVAAALEGRFRRAFDPPAPGTQNAGPADVPERATQNARIMVVSSGSTPPLGEG